ncbi:MAG: glycine zipper domain-containing protein [Planctomycetota bacterium]
MAKSAENQETRAAEQAEAEKLRAEIETLQEDLRAIKDSLQTEGRLVMHDIGERCRAKGDQAVGRARDCISEQPLASVAIAAGAGMILGFLLRR